MLFYLTYSFCGPTCSVTHNVRMAGGNDKMDDQGMLLFFCYIPTECCETDEGTAAMHDETGKGTNGYCQRQDQI